MTESNDINNPQWRALRSSIYLRDKGICWVCNEFVELTEYDLGHLIDRANGGWNDYDNLAVMHTSCNLAKPHHNTLEEAMRWRLLLRTPNKYHTTYHEQPIYHHKQIQPPQPKQVVIIKPKESFLSKMFKMMRKNNPVVTTINNMPSDKRQAKYNEQCAKIKPCTFCWIQGYPTGGAMWRLIPPDNNGKYLKENAFIMRQTPKGAIEPNGQKGVLGTIQILNGKLKEPIDIELGWINYHVVPTDKGLSVTALCNNRANIGERQKTIGQGRGQIPVEEWLTAKSQGISLSEFKDNYFKKQPEN
jgi:hypothetical protein